MKNCLSVPFLIVMVFASAVATNAQGVWLGIPLQSGMIQNMTPLYCHLVARGKPYADIIPGETIYSGARKGHMMSIRGGFGSYSQSQNIQIPIAAICFADAGFKQYVGAAGYVFNVPGGGYSSTNGWIIRPGNVQPFDRSAAEFLTSGPFKSALSLKNAKLPFPGPFAAGYQTIQFVNNSKYDLTARMIVGGVQTDLIQPAGSIYYVEIPGYRQVMIDIKATDPASNDIVGVWEQIFSGQTNGISAQNFILNNNSFR